MVHKKVVTVKRKSDGKEIVVPYDHFAVNDPRFDVVKKKRPVKKADE